MKRLVKMVGLMVGICLLLPGIANAVGSCTQQFADISDTGMRTVTLSCTGHATGGSFPAITIREQVFGMVLVADVNPGATAPTANYDITLTNTDGIDLFGSALTNRSATVSERTLPLRDGVYSAMVSDGTLVLNITGNSVNSATTVIKITWLQMEGR